MGKFFILPCVDEFKTTEAVTTQSIGKFQVPSRERLGKEIIGHKSLC